MVSGLDPAMMSAHRAIEARTRAACRADPLLAHAVTFRCAVYAGTLSPHMALKQLAASLPDMDVAAVRALWDRAWWSGITPEPANRARKRATKDPV